VQKKIIGIESGRRLAVNPDLRPQPPNSAANKPNHWVRKSFVAMFSMGAHPRTIARTYRRSGEQVQEADVLAEIRERVVCAGGLDARKAA
jgi:hypothetical protein